MNYGKSAYLKVIELEKKIDNSNQNYFDKNGYIEFDKPKLNELLKDNKHSEDFPAISLVKDQDICFQIQINVSSSQSDTIKTSIYLDETEIHEEDNQIEAGTNEFMIIKTFTPIATKQHKVTLVFKNTSASNTVKILSVKLVILGISGLSENSAIEMNALAFGENIIVSFIDSNQLFYQICKPEPQSISKEKFIKYSKAISHCFMKKSSSSISKEDLYLLVVDTENNLKLVSPFSAAEEVLLDTGVSFVCGSLLEDHEDQNLIVYVKGGEVYYSTITDNKIIKGRKIPLSDTNFKEVCIATNNESEYVYLIATNQDNSSYILRSLLETASGKFTETISASYMIKVSKYIDMELCNKKSIEHLSLLANFLTSPYVLIDTFYNTKSISTLKCSFSYSAVEYFYEETYLYGVKLDKNNPNSASWVTYTDDAVGFKPAYMDFENDVFVDNGWQSRWPFNKLKPCIINKTTHELKYLDKNDYTKLADGQNSNNNKASSNFVMVEIPRIYYKISSDENYNYIQITNKEKEGFSAYAFDCFQVQNEYLYVSAYFGNFEEASSQSYKNYSGKEIRLKENLTWNRASSYLISYAGYCFSLPFHVLTLLGCLFAVMFKSTNVRKSLGVGVTEKKDKYYAGELDKKGMYYGTNTSGRIKLFGIEDLYGLTRTASGGIEINSSNKWIWHDPTTRGHYGGTSSSLYSEMTGDNVKLPHTKSDEKFVTVNISGDTRLGFFGVNTETNTNSENGFCETSCISCPGHVIAVGNEEGVGGGLFALEAIPSDEEKTLALRPCLWNNLIR